MKYLCSTGIAAALVATPMLVQATPPTSFGGGVSMTAQSTKGTGKLRDTTAHTVTESGAIISTSTDKNDGETPNGGTGTGGESSGGDGKNK